MDIKKFKSLGFWIGLVGIMLAVTGNEIGDFQTWTQLGQYLRNITRNPAIIAGLVMAFYGNWNNATKKGIN